MNILIAGKYAPGGIRPIGGVQSWIATVADALRCAGHRVTVWAPERGATPNDRFDAGILSNLIQTNACRALCDRVIGITHGIIEHEAPVLGMPFAATSEGVRDHWGITAPVIRQPIDLEYWNDAGHKRRGLVRYSYRGGLPWIANLAQSLGMSYQHIRQATHAEARDAMRRAACVLATGRAALEAMACGAPTVIVDHRSTYQSPLMDADIERQMLNNYSGRAGLAPTPDRLASAIRSARPMRSHVEQHHDARVIAAQILEAAA